MAGLSWIKEKPRPIRRGFCNLRFNLPTRLVLADRFFNLFQFWESSFLQFGEDEFPVNADLEASAVGRYYGQRGDILFLLFEYLIRHTDGFREVPSACAVLNF